MRRLTSIFSLIFLIFLFISLASGQTVDIRILHLNDFHGFVEPFKPLGSTEMVGGMAFLAVRVKELGKEKPSLLLASGDMIQGHNWANLFKGKSAIDLMNEMEFDAMVVGNHEFDFGLEVLHKRISEARFPILGANVKGLEGFKPYVIKEIRGIRIGIIGVVTEDVNATTHPKNVAGLQFFSPLKTVSQYVKEVRSNVDILLVLSHIGYPVDRTLAEKVEGIDIIVGGHSHTKVTKPVKVEKTLIVQAWEQGKVLGVLDLSIKDGKIIGFDGYLEEIKPKAGKEDPNVRAIIVAYGQKMDALLNQKVGKSDVDLDGERGNVRTRETNLGNFIADTMRLVSKADIAILNGGGIRAGIRKGEIKVKDIYNALPFDNYIIALQVTGKQIREALEHGVSGVEDEEGRFPQVSGINFSYSRSAKRGSRIREILIAGKPIDPDRQYIVAINDFLAAGGDGYKMLEEAVNTTKGYSIMGGSMKGEKIVYNDSGRWLRDVVVEFIRETGRVAPKVEARIVELD